jgi:hypothetical protein
MNEWIKALRETTIPTNRIETLAAYAEQDARIRGTHGDNETNSRLLLTALQLLATVNNFEKIKIVTEPNFIESSEPQIFTENSFCTTKGKMHQINNYEFRVDQAANYLKQKTFEHCCICAKDDLRELFEDDNIKTIYIYHLFSYAQANDLTASHPFSNTRFLSRFELVDKYDNITDEGLKLFIDHGL